MLEHARTRGEREEGPHRDQGEADKLGTGERGLEPRARRIGEISRELGVRYIVQGSARQANDRLPVSAELGDARTGSQLWSERFDGQGKDMFDIQDRIVRSILGTLAKLPSLEQQRVKAKLIESLYSGGAQRASEV
jgi:hypothetical protein